MRTLGAESQACVSVEPVQATCRRGETAHEQVVAGLAGDRRPRLVMGQLSGDRLVGVAVKAIEAIDRQKN